jgi:hypothetical protein
MLSDLSTWLSVFKYLGLCLAAGSSIWGTVNELTVRTPSRRRRLTRAGVVAILLTIFGLIISLVSEDLGRRNADAARRAQSLEEARRTNQIIVAGQQMTSLSMRWEIDSASAELWDRMKAGQADIDENNKSTQGGVPEVPFDVEEYEAALVPLLSFVARVGEESKNSEAPKTDQSNPAAKDNTPANQGDSSGSNGDKAPPIPLASPDTTASNTSQTEQPLKAGDPSDNMVVLVALDASPNAVLSFGSIGSDVNWLDGAAKQGTRPSAGFVQPDGSLVEGLTPSVDAQLASSREAGTSNYTITWNLDPSVLADSIARINKSVPVTGNLPKVLEVAIFHDFSELPFSENDFSHSSVEIWARNEWSRTKVNRTGSTFSNMTISFIVNGVDDIQYKYSLKAVFISDLVNKEDETVEIASHCTILELESTEP